MNLDINQVTKKFKDKNALSNISLTFEPCKIYGLLGRNGAGKSTLLNIIANRSFASSGAVLLDSKNIQGNEDLLNHIYLMSEDNLFPSNMKVKDMFKISESFYGSFNWNLANQMANEFELNLKLTFKKLSTGYQSIAKLIIALCVPCDYIFLDEPVLGLDATHRELFYSFLIHTYEEHPRSFIISTHLIEEITTLLEEIIIIDKGELKITSDVESLLQTHFSLSGPKEIVTDFANQFEIIGRDELGDYITVYVSGHFPSNIPESITVNSLNLQTYFIQLTNRKKGI